MHRALWNLVTTLQHLAKVSVLICGAAAAAVPHTVSYQGRLHDAGSPVTATVNMTFTLYDAMMGGNLLYDESQSVSVGNGLFSVTIGAVKPLNLPFDVPYYLGISIGGNPELLPRQPLTASPYALRAGVSDALASSASVGGAQITGVIAMATLPATNVSGTIGSTQLANGAVTQPKLAVAGAVAANKVLGTDGTNLQWQNANSGTVTSVGTGAGLGPVHTTNASANGVGGAQGKARDDAKAGRLR